MTIYKLMELLKKVDARDIYKPGISELKDFTDEEIDLILSSNNQREVIRLIKNTDFRSQSKETQKKIIEIIVNFNGNSDVLYYALDVATNKNAINSGCIIEIIEIIIQLVDTDKISIISSIVKNPIATSHKDILKMIQMIVESKLNKSILTYAQMLIENEYAFRTGNVFEAFESILNAQNEKEVQKIFQNKMEEGLKISLLNALDEEKVDAVNFWNLLAEDYEMALKLLILAKFSKSIIIEAKVVADEKEYEELMDKYFLENIAEPYSQKNEELSPNIKIRRKENKRK